MWNAELYTRKHGFVHEYGKNLIGLLHPKEGEQILDVGCGTGELTAKIAGLGAKVVGIDASAEMITAARAVFTGIDFRRANVETFRTEDRFDAVFSNAALHWVLDPKAAIKTMFTLLKPGGRLVVEFGGKGNVEQIIEQVRASLIKRGFSKNAKINPWYFPSLGTYTKALEDEGFEVVFAQLFDRPTPLKDAESGMRNWLRMFAGEFFVGIDTSEQDKLVQEVDSALRPALFRNTTWYADYCRLQVVAHKV